MTVLGAIVLPSTPAEQLPEVARAADRSGLDELWLWEDCFCAGGVAMMSAALALTTRLRVAVGILPVPLRNPALCAMEIATLHHLFGDRAIVGLGHGVQDWMGQVGGRVESPMTLLREYVTAVAELLRGADVSMQGRYVNLDRVRLERPPTSPPRLFVGATGRKTLRLARELAGGTILAGGSSPDEVREASRHIGGFDHRLVVFVPAAPGPGVDGRHRLELQAQRFGFADPGISGSAAQIAEGVRRWTDAGADTVVLQPLADEPDPVSFVQFVAEEVRPLVT